MTGILRCTKCAHEINAPCKCGVSYEYIRPGKAAEIALKADSERGNKTIASEIHIDESTVRAARKRIGKTETMSGNPDIVPEKPEKRTIKGGRSYTMPKHIEKAKRFHEELDKAGVPYTFVSIERAKPTGRMPDDTWEKYEESIELIKSNLFQLEILTEYADQMSDELRCLLADKLKGIKTQTDAIAKKMLGKNDLRNINRPSCDIIIPFRKSSDGKDLF
jgi:hypothetical protein